MKFLQDCWIALLELLNLATFSTTGGPSLQQALQQPDHQFPLPDHASKPPIFQPPSGPEDPRSTFECDYSAMGNQWVPCSSPEDRKCWLAGPAGDRFDINTDYERRYPNGTTRKYYLVVDEDSTLNADGLVMPDAKVFNGSYPGPWVEACWGDIIEVTVENRLAYNGTSIHWHGVRQLGSLEMDGVNAVTQCPIAPGDKFTYRFRAMQYGTTWYHSHYSLQYGDGLVGPLTIHGPSATEYDDPRDPILMTDWNHRSGFKDFHTELVANPAIGLIPPLMDDILLNGIGCYAGGVNCGSKYNTTFEKGKKYLLRLINTSVSTTFIFTIDNHNITVMSSDFVPIHPYTTNSVLVGIGQRYHVVVTALPKETSGKDSTAEGFWIRTIPAAGCSGFSNGGVPDERQGIVFYGEDKNLLPTTQRNPGIDITCSDEPYEKLVPIIPWTIGKASNAHDPTTIGKFGDYFGVGLQAPAPGQGRPLPSDPFPHWAIGDRPLHLNFNDPTILDLDNKTFNPEYVVIPEDYPEGWVYLLITDTAKPDNPTRANATVAHPIHLHGHDFALLAQSNQSITANPPKLKLDNPPRRDVTLLPARGYIIIAFKADNPGVWLMHCHIAWHASSGLALQILERQETARRQLTPARLKETKRVCDKWNTWFANESNHWPGPEEPRVGPFQEDSGI